MVSLLQERMGMICWQTIKAAVQYSNDRRERQSRCHQSKEARLLAEAALGSLVVQVGATIPHKNATLAATPLVAIGATILTIGRVEGAVVARILAPRVPAGVIGLGSLEAALVGGTHRGRS